MVCLDDLKSLENRLIVDKYTSKYYKALIQWATELSWIDGLEDFPREQK